MAQVLVVDDDTLVRRTLVLALRLEDHAVKEAEDGAKALEILERETFDVVVTDIMMPNVEGIGLIRAVRRKHPSLKIVAISGGGRMGNLEFLHMATALGAHVTLSKPFFPEQLQKAVDEALAAPSSTP